MTSCRYAIPKERRIETRPDIPGRPTMVDYVYRLYPDDKNIVNTYLFHTLAAIPQYPERSVWYWFRYARSSRGQCQIKRASYPVKEYR